MTFSIVALDGDTGMLGCAIASAVPAVGSVCIHIAPHVGVIATQSWVNPYLGIDGLAALRGGADSQTVLDALLLKDPERDKRQLAIVDASGASSSFTGVGCTGWAGSSSTMGVSVQGNMLVSGATLAAMSDSFAVSDPSGDTFAQRLIAALVAGQLAGGDRRGRQSAAIKVYADEDYPLVDLRVDDHRDAVVELTRVHEVASRQALPYTRMMPTRANASGRRDAATEAMLMMSPDARNHHYSEQISL